MRQPTLPNRKRPVFVRCPVCGTEFWSTADQRWCSRECAGAARCGAGGAPQRRLMVLTPAGRFQSMVSAARHHNVTRATVRRRIREGCPGWQFEAPYQTPADFVPSGTPWPTRKDRP
jgi:hypothetical protein